MERDMANDNAARDADRACDAPGSVICYVKMAAAVVTGTRPDIGENRKVAM
jgi:hypothetical protein